MDVKNVMDIDDYIENCCEDAIRFDGLDECVIGTDQNNLLCYSHTKIIKHFIKNEGMTKEESIEWIDFNIACVNSGNGFTLVFDE